MADSSNITTGLKITAQIPLDIKGNIKDEATLAYLGVSDNLAFTYHERLEINCLAEGSRFVWREVEVGEENTGLVPLDFTYPNGIVTYGVDYSNRTFNFFRVIVSNTLNNVGSGSGVYKDTTSIGGNSQFNLKSLKVSSVGAGDTLPKDIDVSNPDELNIRLKTVKLESTGTGIDVIKDIDVSNPDELNFRFKKLNTNTLSITTDGDSITIDTPPAFAGKDYYVNLNYDGAQGQTGSPSKPFITLPTCVNVILNREHVDALGVLQFVPNPAVNGGVAWNKWEHRGNENIRVIIQSYSETIENLAINRVTYLLDGFDKGAAIQVAPATNMELIINMEELTIGVPKSGGQLPYEINTTLVGNGNFNNFSNIREGYVRAQGFSDGTLNEQPDSNLFVGSPTSLIEFVMGKHPSLAYTTLTGDDDLTPIVREGVTMTGFQSVADPGYGAIECKQKNAQFGESLFLAGDLRVNCFEQHLLYVDNGNVYGEVGQLYNKRSLQHINYDTKQLLERDVTPGNAHKYYVPSKFIYDIYAKNGSSVSYGGRLYSQENTGANQGGVEAAMCVESLLDTKLSNISLSGGGVLAQLFYNHFVKVINHSSFSTYTTGRINLKGLNINCNPFEELVSVVTQAGATYTTVLNVGDFSKVRMYNLFNQGDRRLPLSNMTINTDLYISTVDTLLANTVFTPSLPEYANNAAALAALLPVGALYTTTGSIKIVT